MPSSNSVADRIRQQTDQYSRMALQEKIGHLDQANFNLTKTLEQVRASYVEHTSLLIDFILERIPDQAQWPPALVELIAERTEKQIAAGMAASSWPTIEAGVAEPSQMFELER